MSKYAYVTVLYGSNIYLTGALVLGYSLWRTKTSHDRIILVTPDVSDEYRIFLRQIYTNVISIEYMDVNESIFLNQATRFRDVFTKLQALSLIEYDKIILLDLDMIISKNIDHLFKLSTPAAMLKHKDISYGKIIPENMMCKDGKMTGSINAGLMLLKPDLNELDIIKKEVLTNDHMMKLKYPEQDYLSLRYCGKWTSITFNYNYQFGLTNRVKKSNYSIDKIYVIHYSSSYKPWNLLIKEHFFSEDEIVFRNMHKAYYDIWIKSYEFIKEWFIKKEMVLPY